jgi:uncharacterized membrane protein
MAENARPRGAATEAAAEEKETGRLEAFSDGVFAIAVTLLVLDLKVPKPAELAAAAASGGAGGLLGALLQQWPTFLAYITSFFTILVMWVNHHVLFNLVRRIDRVFLFLNGLLLLFVTFVPFPTALVAAYMSQPRDGSVAAAIYGGTYLGLAVAFNLLWRHASGGRRLLGPRVPAAAVSAIDRSYRVGIPAYLAVFVLAFVSVPWCIGSSLALAVYFSVAGARRMHTGADSV